MATAVPRGVPGPLRPDRSARLCRLWGQLRRTLRAVSGWAGRASYQRLPALRRSDGRTGRNVWQRPPRPSPRCASGGGVLVRRNRRRPGSAFQARRGRWRWHVAGAGHGDGLARRGARAGLAACCARAGSPALAPAAQARIRPSPLAGSGNRPAARHARRRWPAVAVSGEPAPGGPSCHVARPERGRGVRGASGAPPCRPPLRPGRRCVHVGCDGTSVRAGPPGRRRRRGGDACGLPKLIRLRLAAGPGRAQARRVRAPPAMGWCASWLGQLPSAKKLQSNLDRVRSLATVSRPSHGTEVRCGGDL